MLLSTDEINLIFSLYERLNNLSTKRGISKEVYLSRNTYLSTDGLNFEILLELFNKKIIAVDNQKQIKHFIFTADGYEIAKAISLGTYVQETEEDTGLSVFWKGVWESSKSYAPGSLVELNSILYISLEESFNKSPTTNPDFWQQISFFTETEKSKLEVVENRPNHTGTQSISTIENLEDTLGIKLSSYGITAIKSISQFEYNTLQTKETSTLYVVSEAL